MWDVTVSVCAVAVAMWVVSARARATTAAMLTVIDSLGAIM